jgi:hypothetical protein
MVRDQKLDPGRATSLMNELQSGAGKIVDDPKEAMRVRLDLQNLSEDEIKSNNKLSYDTRTELLLKKQELANSWKSTQAAQEAEHRIERALGIVPGTNRNMLTEAEQEQLDQAKTTWYNEIDKLPAGERQAAVIQTAEDVVGRFIRKNKASKAQEARANKQRFIAASQAKFGSPDQLDEQARKKYQETLSRYDTQIAQFEAEAARK